MLVFDTANVRQKLSELESACQSALLKNCALSGPSVARDLKVMDSRILPPREGLSIVAGRARMLHDLASIELQAMELALRSLVEYPDAPSEFREELAALALSEGTHLRLCLDGIESLGFKWGDWPVHLGLWNAVAADDSLIDRVLIVHRYLEASGLDAGDKMLRRLYGMGLREPTVEILERIHREEIPHVDFGSQWYRRLCTAEGLDASSDFETRMTRLRCILPYRTEQIAVAPRLAAGFTLEEIEVLRRWRETRPRVEGRG